MTLYLFLAGIGLLLMVLGIPFNILSANTTLPRYVDQDIRSFPVAAAVRLYRHAAVGRNPAGHVKPFQPGDEFVGFAYEEKDNSSGAAAAVSIKVETQGDYELAVANLALTDVNRPVFATADDAFSFTGHPDGYVGRVVAYISSGVGLVRLKPFGQAAADGDGCVNMVWDGAARRFAPVLTAGNEQFIGGAWRLDAIGAGITAGGVAPVSGSDETSMLLDNDSEAQNLTIEGPMVLNITKGATFEFEGRLKTAGGAATDDMDWGLMGTTGGIALADAQRADMNSTAGTLVSCLFHLNCNANDIFVSSDDDANPIAAADTGVDNSLTVNAKFKIIVRPGGACEVWINGVRVLSTTAFSVGATGMLCGIVNLEKSTGTGVPEARVRRMRMAGASA